MLPSVVDFVQAAADVDQATHACSGRNDLSGREAVSRGLVAFVENAVVGALEGQGAVVEEAGRQELPELGGLERVTEPVRAEAAKLAREPEEPGLHQRDHATLTTEAEAADDRVGRHLHAGGGGAQLHPAGDDARGAHAQAAALLAAGALGPGGDRTVDGDRPREEVPGARIHLAERACGGADVGAAGRHVLVVEADPHGDSLIGGGEGHALVAAVGVEFLVLCGHGRRGPEEQPGAGPGLVELDADRAALGASGHHDAIPGQRGRQHLAVDRSGSCENAGRRRGGGEQGEEEREGEGATHGASLPNCERRQPASRCVGPSRGPTRRYAAACSAQSR